ncbi:MAG: nucleotidyltransferase [Bacillales bacterium]|jgi:predicted nucleotidyltransferase|nr:nucleotidyltransferase [Bacillales bacterium]
MKLEAIEAAKNFINKYFPDCQGALLAGSVTRGEATETSDLDIVIFHKDIPSAYRESLIESGWPIEVFVHNFTSYLEYFESDCKRARPSLPRMVSEGLVLKDENILDNIKSEAQEFLNKGPEVWTDNTIILKRYFITDVLEDFIGCTNRSEGIFVANSLAELVSEFVLRTNRKWTGTSKWALRSLKQYDLEFAEKFVYAFDEYYKNNKKCAVINLVDDVLQPYGGRMFEGFSLGK